MRSIEMLNGMIEKTKTQSDNSTNNQNQSIEIGALLDALIDIKGGIEKMNETFINQMSVQTETLSGDNESQESETETGE